MPSGRTRLSCQKFRNNEVRLQLHALGLQPRQLQVRTQGLAEGGGALVSDHAQGLSGKADKG